MARKARQALGTYHDKRDFAVTPEPAGGKIGPRTGPLTFVVQQHAARRMHYDFRLELDGVLVSWAIPKGPSFDPKDKRLAVQTEDHPLEYADFEGVIPRGEYGGGTVMVWDRGYWFPDADAARDLDKGDIRFRLEGEKLRGGWRLVKTKGQEGNKAQWLLFKRKDVEARADGPSIVDSAPRSVITGRDLAEIEADGDRTWTRSIETGAMTAVGLGDPAAVPGARRAGLPRDLAPQLATLAADVPSDAGWLHELKLDGYRLLAIKDGDSARLITRNALDWADRFPQLAEAVAALPCKTAILDGEAVVLDARGISRFGELQKAQKRRRDDLYLFAFDLLYQDGHDLRGATLRARKEQLRLLLAASGGKTIRYSDHVDGDGGAFFDAACAAGSEGIISKRADARYRAGRSRDWLKIKCRLRQEVVIVGYTDSSSASRAGFGAIAIGVYDGGELHYAGKVGTGFDHRTLVELGHRLEALDRDDPPVVNPPGGAEGRAIHWIEPRLVAEIELAEWTDDGVVRQGAFIGLREDKAPTEVTRERAVEPPPPRIEPRPLAGTRIVGIKISNPDKVMYPEAGVTKLDLARYYEAIGELFVPHVRGRPLTLVRCPDGHHKQCFYQKHAADMIPAAIPRVIIPPDEEPYLAVDELAHVIALVQLGTLEFHISDARKDRLDRPDMFVLDLDPDEAVPWRRVVDTAAILRERLAQLELTAFVKSTGGKGLHVVVPIQRRHGWDEVKSFTHAIARELAAAAPSDYTASIAKKDRPGKIFIDYLRNSEGATAIAPLSVRARPGAPTAMTLSWDEVEHLKEAPLFSLHDAVTHLTRRKRDPWESFDGERRSLAPAIRRLGGITTKRRR